MRLLKKKIIEKLEEDGYEVTDEENYVALRKKNQLVAEIVPWGTGMAVLSPKDVWTAHKIADITPQSNHLGVLFYGEYVETNIPIEFKFIDAA